MVVMMMGPLEPGNLIWMSISIISIPWLPAGVHKPLPLRCSITIRPWSSGVGSAGWLTHRPTLRGAHNPQIFRVFAVIHSPTVVFAVLQGLLWAVTAYIIHPYWALKKNKRCKTWFTLIFIDQVTDWPMHLNISQNHFLNTLPLIFSATLI